MVKRRIDVSCQDCEFWHLCHDDFCIKEERKREIEGFYDNEVVLDD